VTELLFNDYRPGVQNLDLNIYVLERETLLKLFEYMIRMDVTEAACVTHGGVIMSMLSQRAVPTRRPEQWMADPGCGYTVQTDVLLWMRDRLVEAIDIVPFGYADTLRGQAETEENEAFE